MILALFLFKSVVSIFIIHMYNKLKKLTSEDKNNFTTLVKAKNNGKLLADDCVRLNKHIYRDYVKKLKQFSGSSYHRNPEK